MGPIFHATSITQALMARYLDRASQDTLDPTPDETLRLSHYFKLTEPFSLPDPTFYTVPLFKKTAYSYDFWRCLGRTDPSRRFRVEFGDVREVPEFPTFVKSRPLGQNNANSVLLPLEMARHFHFPTDPFHWDRKKDMAVFRGACHQPWRKRFLQATEGSSLVDVGDTSKSSDTIKFQKPFMSPTEQMRFKFIISLEGNDVASNLKWAMHSNSVVIMPRPKFETWFCESHLVAGEHYLETLDDYSDLSDVITDAIRDDDRCRYIANRATEYCRRFQSKARQYELGRNVMDQYFKNAQHTDARVNS